MLEIYAQKINGMWFGVGCENQQVFVTSFGCCEQSVLKNILNKAPFNMPFQVFMEPSAFAKNALDVLSNIYEAKDVSESFPLAMNHLPAYTEKVLKATSMIPLGYLASYGSIAKAVGGSPRAVGNAMAANPFPPIVPCHRVVKSDFTLGGYGGGLDVKGDFLLREKRGFSSLRKIDVNGRFLEVFPVEFVLNANHKSMQASTQSKGKQ